MENTATRRRIKAVIVTPEALLQVLQTEAPRSVSFSGLPSDARVCGGGYDPRENLFYLHVESETFPEYLPGNTIERMSVTVHTSAK